MRRLILAILMVLLVGTPGFAEDLKLDLLWWNGSGIFTTGCLGDGTPEQEQNTICINTAAGHGMPPTLQHKEVFEPLRMRIMLDKNSPYTGDVCQFDLQWQVPVADSTVSRPRGFHGSNIFPYGNYGSLYTYQTDLPIPSVPGEKWCDVATQTCWESDEYLAKPCVCRPHDVPIPTVGERMITWSEGYSGYKYNVGGSIGLPHDDVQTTAGIGGVNLTDKPFNTLNFNVLSTDGNDIFEQEDTTENYIISADLLFASALNAEEGGCNNSAVDHQTQCRRGYDNWPWETQQDASAREFNDFSAHKQEFQLPLLSATAVECSTGNPLTIEIGANTPSDRHLRIGPANASFPATRSHTFSTDNCLEVWNPEQRDYDHDGIGDACDADYNNDGMVHSSATEDGPGIKSTAQAGGPDFGEFTACFGCKYDEACWTGANECAEKDHNADGSIGGPDFGFFLSAFGNPDAGLAFSWARFGAKQFICAGHSEVPEELVIPSEEEFALAENTYLVELNSHADLLPEVAAAQAKSAIIKRQFRGKAFSGYSTHLPNKGVAKALSRRPKVKRVIQSFAVPLSAASGSWGQDRVDQLNLPLDDIYTVTDGSDGTGVHVYIFDTGIDADHSELSGALGDYYSAVHGTENIAADIEDPHGHGSHVAGTIASTTYGIATGATIHPVQVCRQSTCYYDDIIDGIDWAMQHVADNSYVDVVGNMSLGGRAYSGGEFADIDWFGDSICGWLDAGHTMAVSAGNNHGIDACGRSPARIDGVITLAASTIDDKYAPFTNLGQCVDLYAPGVNIVSAWKEGGTNTISGTSMSSPHTAGAAALYLERNTGHTPAQVVAGLLSDASNGKITNNVSSLYDDTATPNELLCIQAGGC